MSQPQAVDCHIGCGVVALDDHQSQGVAQCKRQRRCELAQHPRPSRLILLGQHKFVCQSSLSRANLLGGIQQNAQLDNRGSLHGLIRID